MSSKLLQRTFFFGILSITLYFTLFFGVHWIRYLSLQKKTIAHIQQWEILEINEQYALKAVYDYKIQGKTWQNSFTFSPPYYLNEAAALYELKYKAKESWDVWYKEKDPQVSALERNFPWNLFLRALICCGVLTYFFRLYKRLVLV